MAREDRSANSMKDTAWRSPDHSARAGLKSGLQEAESLIARIGERRRSHQPLLKPSVSASVLTSIPRSKAQGGSPERTSVPGPASRAEGNGPLLISNRSVSV